MKGRRKTNKRVRTNERSK